MNQNKANHQSPADNCSSMRFSKIALAGIFVFACTVRAADISGELKKWHRVTLTFDGPDTGETDAVNPFTDYRLNVTFENGKRKHVVAGHDALEYRVLPYQSLVFSLI